MTTTRLDDLIKRLQASGVRMTGQRREILDSILSYDRSHFTVEHLYTFMVSRQSKLGIATVFRTLPLFERVGIINKVTFEDKANAYELLSPDSHQHHHLVCSHCGRITEMEVDWLDAVEELVRSRYHFQISNHRLDFIGLCEACQKTVP